MSEQFHVCDDRNQRLSANFTAGEFTKSDHQGPWFVAVDLVLKLQAMREKLGIGITITSGYRDPAHNRKIGGASKSQHMSGRAADIKVSGMTVIEIAQVAWACGFRALGIAATFLHVDVRPDAPESGVFWSYSGDEKVPPRTIEIIKTGK